MKKATCLAGFLTASFLFITAFVYPQTSWTGATSNAWNKTANWTNGIPTATSDVVIGDGSFTGSFQPSISAAAYCRNLQLGGTKASTLDISKNFTITGNLTVTANGTIAHTRATITIQGNWINNGSYSATNNNAIVSFGGVSQTIGGTVATVFRRLKINAGSNVTLASNISSAGSANYIYVYGTLNPGQTTQYSVTAASAITVFSAGVLKVNAATLGQNYVPTISLSAGSIVDYSSTSLNQTISPLTYSTLKISGSTIKSLAANLPALSSSTAAEGNIYVNSGTLDLGGYTANRGTTIAGGTFSVSNAATLKIGGTNTFPTNYGSTALSLTSNTEYNGTAQTVAAKTYGNLTLSSSSGLAAKTTASADFTVAGNLVTNVGSGSGVTFTAGANITISGIDSIGASTTFNGGAYAHNIAGNWVNNGTFTGSSSTINMTGAGSTISGAGIQNFYNLNIAASNIVASSSALVIAGNLATTGSGTFSHATGMITFNGAGKTITGSGITLHNFSVSGSTSTTSSVTVSGDFACSGTFSASSGNIKLTGTSKIISGSGSAAFYGLVVPGIITTTSNFSVADGLDVSGSLTATAGTATFTGAATLNGTVNLYNVTLNATSLLLSTNSVLGISNVFTITAGTLNVSTAIPNTVSFNGPGAQNIPAASFDRLTLANGGTKTAVGNISTNGIFTINSNVTFNAASYTHTVQNNFINNGSFAAGSSIVSFTGSKDATISGATTFNELRVNKSSSANVVTLLNNVTAPLVTMTNGVVKTGSNTITITNTRTGAGIILGTIRRSHVFTTGVSYAFESPDNSIIFSSVSGVNVVTVAVSPATVTDFPYGAAVNRLYDIAVPAGTYNATLRLHYNDAELNGNTETSMLLWKYNGSAWATIGKTASSSTANYVEQTGLTNIANRWAFSGVASVLRWNGAVSTDWNTAGNWTAVQGAPGAIPGAFDVVQIGQGPIINQPLISTAVAVKNIEYGSVAAATLTIGTGGSLQTTGNISGTWTSGAVHTINVGAQSMTINGSLLLTDGVAGHAINLDVTTGTVTIGESLQQGGGANIILSGAAALHIGESFLYSNGTFTAGTSTVFYEGNAFQEVGGVNYYNLTIVKSNGIASINSPLAIGGSMSITGGELNLNANTTLAGNLVINPGSTISFNEVTMTIGGNLNNSGNFIPGSGTISFTGTGNQLISLATFNNIIINKPSGSTNFTGSIDVYGNFSLLAGNIDIGNYTANRTSLGGIFTLAAGTSLTVSGTSNFPSNYTSNILDPTSTVIYNGTGTQLVNGVAYGNLVFSNGGSNVKTLSGHSTVTGNITINSGATLNGASYNLALNGNWINNGTFVPSTGAVLLMGSSKTVMGATTFNKLTIYGTYTVAGSNIVYNGLVNVIAGGSYNGGSGVGTVNGDLINSGTLISSGTTTFSGTTIQTIRLLSPIQSTANGIINFNGTIAPILNSTATPLFATVNINNTGGVTASVNWIIGVAFNVSNGATFNGGVSTHFFYGNFVNNGTVTSAGTLSFLPSSPITYSLAGTVFSSTGTVNFGGSAAITVTGMPSLLTDVIIANTTGVTPSNNWTISRNFTINSNAVFNAGTYTHTVAGDIESNGTLNGGTSTFIMNGTGVEISGSPNTTFYDYTVTGVVTANVDFNVSHNFTNNNSFDASIGNLVMTGTGAGIIGGTATPFVLAQVDIAKTGTGVVTLAKALVDVLNIDVLSGVFNTSTYSITQHTEGGSLYIRDLATLQLGGTNTLPNFASYGIDSLSTVEYNGSTQVIASLASAGGNYGNLVISTAGTKTANGSLKILNDFTLSNGSFTMGSYIDTLCGNWTMTSGSLSSTGSTLVLKGAAIQTIGSTGAFNHLTVNKPSGSTVLATNITMAGTLTFILGRITTGANTLVLTSIPGTVAGAGQTTGWVNGRIQKFIPIGTSARSFETGGANVYTPSTVTFASTSSVGNLTASALDGEHPDIANSGVNTLKNVNRYFRFANNGIAFTTASINLNWVAADVDAGSSTAAFKVKSVVASTWTLHSVASPLPTSIQALSVTSFGDFVMGETISASTWTGNSSTGWNTSGNWTSGVPTATTNIIIPGGRPNYPIVTAGTVTVMNVNINTGGAITLSGGALGVNGTITNSGSILATNGGLVLGGITAQSIPPGLFQMNKIKDLTINNAAGVTLGGTLGLSGVLTISSGQFTTGGYLTLESSASGTARVAPVTGTISGNVIVERYSSNRRAWRLLTLPVHHSNTIFSSWQNSGVYEAGKGTFVSGTSPDPLLNGLDYNGTNISSMKTFNTATQAFEEITNTHVTSLSANLHDNSDNIGYFIFVRGDRNPANLVVPNSNATTLSGIGKLQTGLQYFSASPLANRYTLVGNPYASPIDFNLLSKTNLVNRFFVWDPMLNQVGGYVTVDDLATPGVFTASPTSSQTKEIQSGQAFYVVTQANGTAGIGIGESSKSTVTNTAMFRPVNGSSVVASFRTDLYLANAGSTTLADGTLAQFRDEFKSGIDYMDADKFGNVNETIGLLRNDRLLSIERRPRISVGDTLFLKLTKTTARNYQFLFAAENLESQGLNAYLEDSYTRTSTPVSLAGTTKVNFTVINNTASMTPNRFRIVFKLASVLPVTYTSVKAKQVNKNIAVEWKVENQQNIKEYQVERSADGSNFIQLYTTLPLASSTSTYQWLDENPIAGSKFYRIRNVDKDGSVQYSSIVEVRSPNTSSTIIVYPNPVVNNLIGLKISNLPKGAYQLKLMNMAGQVVFKETIQHPGGSDQHVIETGFKLIPGVYQLEIIHAGSTKATLQVQVK